MPKGHNTILWPKAIIFVKLQKSYLQPEANKICGPKATKLWRHRSGTTLLAPHNSKIKICSYPSHIYQKQPSATFHYAYLTSHKSSVGVWFNATIGEMWLLLWCIIKILELVGPSVCINYGRNITWLIGSKKNVKYIIFSQ